MARTPAIAAGTQKFKTQLEDRQQSGGQQERQLGTSQTSTAEGRPAIAGCNNSTCISGGANSSRDARNRTDVNILLVFAEIR
jgi:hypothetical protein